MKRVAIQPWIRLIESEDTAKSAAELAESGQKWQYFFYADIRFQSYERYMQALSAVRPLISDLDVLGEYTAGQN